MNVASIAVRIFSMPVAGGLPTPRRGAVKVWTAKAERHVASALAPALSRHGARHGLLEFSLKLDPAGRVAAGQVVTGRADSLDADCLSALTDSAAFLAPPPQLQGAECVVLVEFTKAQDTAA